MAEESNNKTIKIGIQADTKSFDDVINKVRTLTNEFNLLVQAASKLNMSGLNITNQPIIPGTGKAPSQQAGAPGGVMGQVMTAGIKANVDFAKDLTKEITGAFNTLESSLRKSVGSSQTEITKLKDNLAGLAKTLDSVKQSGQQVSSQLGFDFSGKRQSYQMNLPGMTNTTGVPIGNPQQQPGTPPNPNQPPGQGLGGAAWGVIGGGVAGIGSVMGMGGGPMAAIGGGINKMGYGLTGLMSGLQSGGALGAMATAGFVAMGVQQAAAIHDAVMESGYSNRLANLREVQAAQEDPYRQRSAQGQFARMAYGALRGDIAGAAAWKAVRDRGDFDRIFSAQRAAIEEDKAVLSTGAAKATFGQVGKELGQAIGTSVAGSQANEPKTYEIRGRGGAVIMRGVEKRGEPVAGFKAENIGNRTELELETKRALEVDAQINKMQTAQNLVQMQLDSMGITAPMLNDVYGGALGRLGAERAGVLGGWSKKFYTSSITGERTRMSNYDLFQASMERSGFSAEQGIAARQAMRAQAGSRYMGAGPGFMSAQLGGLGNVYGMYGLGAQFGGGAAGGQAFVGAMQGTIGAGGLDITAGARLGDYLAQQAQSGNFVTGGNAPVGIWQNMADTSNLFGGDFRGTRIAVSGMDALNNRLSGNLDPLQKGINMVAANQAAGAAEFGTKQALMRMTPVQMMQIINDGKVPDYYANQGVTMDMIQRYLATQQNYLMSRNVAKWGGTSKTGQAVRAAMAQGGNVLDYIKTRAGGLTGKERISAVRSAIEEIAPAVQGETETIEQTLGELGTLAQGAGLLPGVRGRGAYAGITKGSAAAVSAKARAQQTTEEAAIREGAAFKEILTKTLKDIPEIMKQQAKLSADPTVVGSMANSAATASKSMTAFATELQNLANYIKTMINGLPGYNKKASHP